MPALLNRYATPLITGLFLVSLVSGVALFFHVGSSWFHGMHEWLSLLLILPFVLHLWKNWRPLVCYLKRAPMWVALAASVALAALFVLPVSGSGGAGGRPVQFAFAERMLDGTVEELAAVLNLEPAALYARLASAGIERTGGEDAPAPSLRDLAASGALGSNEVMALLLAASR
jgi:hypothetical protein